MISNNLHMGHGQTNSTVFDHTRFAPSILRDEEPNPIKKNASFIVQYKPKFCVKTKRAVGVEPQVWFKNYVYQTARPCDPNLRYTDQIVVRMTKLSLQQALYDCAMWDRMDLSLNLTVNVSAKQISEAAFPQSISHLLEQYRIAPKRLTLNVLPSRSIYDQDKLVASLAILNLLGIKLSLAQFGGESASITLLGSAKFSEVKIDDSIISTISYSQSSKSILLNLISLAKNLNLKVTAGCIKYNYQRGLLNEYGIDYIQGEECSKQLTAKEICGLASRPN